MGLQLRSRVLDVGCGLGGSAFLMARDFGLMVDGIDLSSNMLMLAKDKLLAYGLEDQVTFEHGNCLELNRSDFYDGIYSRDVFLHIKDKSRLFSVLHSSLRSGGKLLFTDYCCGVKPWSTDFTEYVKDRGYILRTLSEYAELVSDAGFVDVAYTDLTDQFIAILQNDLKRFSSLAIEITACDQLEKGWKDKLVRVKSGNHCWGLFTASK